MFTILWWTLSVLLDSIATSTYKKSLQIWNISKVMFKFYAYIFGIAIYLSLIIFVWFQLDIFNNHHYLFAIFWIAAFHIIVTMIWLHVYKNIKLSDLLPYQNIDKLFIIIIWFFLFSWTPWKEVSLFTFYIWIFTIIITMLFTVDFKKIAFPPLIWLHIFNMFLRASMVLSIWVILTKYSTVTYSSLNFLFEWLLYILIWILFHQSFKSLLTQTKEFYKYRIATIFLWHSWFVLWIFVIESAWVVIASLLWFLGIAFNILSMKFILKDTPSKKQSILAMLIILLIWIWYYFK